KRAKTDALTRIANRLAYNEKIKQEFARWQRNAQPFSVCVIDVDKFKGVNDSYGHKAGDKVLKTIAEVCAANIRKMDFFARYGGEEFVLLLPDTALDQAIVVAENLRRKIEVCKFHYAKETVVITVSCGLAQFDKGDTTESVFNRADKALYAAKDQGRNQVMRG
ncbi:MAG: diguanylate cyclase, partial [Gammaproteobacteria bacterium]